MTQPEKRRAPQGASEPPLELTPSLRPLVEAAGLDLKNLSVALEADGQGHIRVCDRHYVPVTDGKKVVSWPVKSLRELVRGQRLPPDDIEHYPPEYVMHFFFIENHLLTLCDAEGDRTDQEMEEIYSTLRRKPDGRSLGPNHDFLWQVAALLLARHPFSQPEYEAFLGALVRSTRKWSLRPVSRNYVDYLRQTIGRHRA